MRFDCEFRDLTGARQLVRVEVDGVELDSVNALRRRSGAEEANAVAHAYAARRGYAQVPAGFSLHNAVRVS
jgi:hypothetical protein